jgi:hypothetical protein
MTPEAIAEYRRIANSEQALSREFVAAMAIHKLCDEVEQLLSEVTRLRNENRMLQIAVNEWESRSIGFKNELDVFEAELNEIDKL